MREHIVGVHILKVYTNITLLLTWRLQSWHKDDCTASAHHHSLWQTAQCESHPVRGAQAVAAYLRDCPLTWRRNTQIQMYWLLKWLQSYNICTFSTWKDKFLFNLLFWIPNSFCTFHEYGRGGTSSLPPLTARHWFFIIQIFEQLSCPEKQSYAETFHCVEIFFYLSGLLSNLCLSWKTECALNSLYWIYIFNHSEFWTTCAYPEKQSLSWNFSLRWNIFYLSGFLRSFGLALKTEFVMKFLTVFNIVFTFRMFQQLLFALKNRVCPEFTVLNMYFLSFKILNNLRLPWKQSFPWNFSLRWNIFLSFMTFEQLVLVLKNRVCPEFTVLNMYF